MTNHYIMRIYLLLMFCILSINSFAQEWTKEQLEVIEEFSLDQKDHRGVVFNNYNESNCSSNHFSTTEDAIISFFTTTIKRDVTTYCIDELGNEVAGKTHGLKEIIEIYLTAKK